YEQYKQQLTGDVRIIPLGVDFDLFAPTNQIKKYDVIFVGADSDIKNFNLVRQIIKACPTLQFCLVLKHHTTETFGKNVSVFSKINHLCLADLHNQSKLLMCTSKHETQHLSGIEAGACNIPIVTTNVGIY